MACNGGGGQWPPIGEWLEIEGPLKPCSNALHLVDAAHLVEWLNAEIFEAEFDGIYYQKDDMPGVWYGRKARLTKHLKHWNRRTARLFAAECAERVLPLFEAQYHNDDCARKAIDAARDYANGKISVDDLERASWAAAEGAARAADTTASAAWVAAWSVRAEAATWAARAAAWSARAEAGTVARAAGTVWAAESVARAAGAATEAVAWAETRAASKTAKEKERKWQTKRLFECLEMVEAGK